MSTIFEQAARLNNEGVTALSNGDNQTAIDKLTQSIKWMKQELSKPGADLRRMKSKNTVYEEEEATQTVEIPEVDSAIAFNQAITIPSTTATSGNDEHGLDIHVYSAAAVFNLALALQHKGEEKKAERLYIMVLKLLLNDHCHLRIAVLIKLASINNLSQIRFANGDFENAREGLDQLSGFLRRAAWIFEVPEVQGLLMNVLLLKAPKVAPAA
jgi:tetratricopeptide (TPR) repeat protein